MAHRLECQGCGEQFDPGLYFRGCPRCRTDGETGRLEVSVTYESIDLSGGDGPSPTMWRYHNALPLPSDDPVTLGEGGTPLVPAEGLNGIEADVYFKNETMNPTGSYKDRLNSLLISNIDYFVDDPKVATASAGNHGASTAAYATRAGIKETIVILPRSADKPVTTQISAYGADAVIADPDPEEGEPADGEDRRDLLGQLVDTGWIPTINMTSEEYVGIPHGYEGYKTISFEIVDQLGSPPDVMVVPVGDGDGLYGIWKGFRELSDRDLVEHTPKMVGVQSTERQPLVKSLEKGEVVADPGPQPITTSTDLTSVGPHAVEAVEESNGFAFAVSRDEVERAVMELGEVGLFAEPSSALVLAGVRHLNRNEDVEGTIVPVITGSGIKWPTVSEEIFGAPPTIEADIRTLARTVSSDVTGE